MPKANLNIYSRSKFVPTSSLFFNPIQSWAGPTLSRVLATEVNAFVLTLNVKREPVSDTKVSSPLFTATIRTAPARTGVSIL